MEKVISRQDVAQRKRSGARALPSPASAAGLPVSSRWTSSPRPVPKADFFLSAGAATRLPTYDGNSRRAEGESQRPAERSRSTGSERASSRLGFFLGSGEGLGLGLGRGLGEKKRREGLFAKLRESATTLRAKPAARTRPESDKPLWADALYGLSRPPAERPRPQAKAEKKAGRASRATEAGPSLLAKFAEATRGSAVALGSSLAAFGRSALGLLQREAARLGDLRRGIRRLHRTEAFSSAGSEPRRPERGVARDAAHAAQANALRLSAIGLGILSLALVLAYGIWRLMPPAFPLPAGELLPDEGAIETVLLDYLSPELAERGEAIPLPAPPATLEIERYTVRPGDSLGSIAKRFRLSIDSLVSMNGIKNSKSLKSGTELRIPNMNGLVHVVGRGESIGSVAARYKIDSTALADANDLGSAVIKPGQSLFIPGARLPDAELRKVFGEYAIWPVRGPLSSPFGYRPNPFTGVRSFHAGIDIVASPGSPVKATMEGRVADAGYNAVFGNYVILNHAEGVQTLYGHLTQYSVRRGQNLSQGAVIGSVGNTGYSTGPHLHFGFFRGGTPVNPLKQLK